MTDSDATCNTQVKKKAVHVSINSELVERARALKINLSQTLEDRLLELLRQKDREHWVKENKDAIAEYNQRVGNQGVFSESLRKF